MRTPYTEQEMAEWRADIDAKRAEYRARMKVIEDLFTSLPHVLLA